MDKINKAKFLIFYKLYRILNALALRCYDIYWGALDKENKCLKKL